MAAALHVYNAQHMTFTAFRFFSFPRHIGAEPLAV